MKIKISTALAERLGEVKMRALNCELRDRAYRRDHYDVDLKDLPQFQILELREWLDELAKLDIRGPKTLIRDIDTWQAAQLGIKADQVESQLMRFLARGSRWNAVVLIDEADVYIRARDTNMEHNAIVAAFLRVLEYQSSILFMTTNLAETVDDAIASRCIARIDYRMPDVGFQQDIWKVLAKANGVRFDKANIRSITDRHPDLTGRDIKQLLKLATLVADNRGGPVNVDDIDFVAQFKPTRKLETKVV